ncbi:hypothetical protein DB346_12865 [Verrucomicrobia bacterium LW23]|nr:hypothetical protein DB346_12865 [Verrucomicrobia bacterium LW23]
MRSRSSCRPLWNATPASPPRIISDNGPRFIARDFKEFIRVTGMTHVRTSPYYPQSNGKLERWHKTLKTNAIRTQTPLTHDDGRRTVDAFVTHYNSVRLHSAIGYVTPHDKLHGRDTTIFSQRNTKLAAARDQRKRQRQQHQQQNQSQPQPQHTQ